MVARVICLGILWLALFASVPARDLPGVGRMFGYVPDSATAIRIAVTVWQPIYGQQQIASERPFRATLTGGIWHVRGSLPPKTAGGVAEADIRRSDGKILRIIHGR